MNGYKVIEVDAFKDWIDIGDIVIRAENITDIVTKDQFASIEYKLDN